MSSFLASNGDQPGPIGAWVKLGAIESVEIMAFAGYDFVVCDMEHSPLSLETVYSHVVTASAHGLAPIVRVPDHSGSTIQRVLDMGAAGVLVPHVDTVEQARDVAAFTRFPPIGKRGSGNTSRAGRWGLLGRQEYLRYGNEDALCLVMLESEQAIENASAILGLPDVSGALVGASDLGLETGLAAEDPALQEMINRAVGSAQRAAKPVGCAIGSSPAQAVASYKRGFSFVVMGNDTSMLAERAAELMAGLREHQSAALIGAQ